MPNDPDRLLSLALHGDHAAGEALTTLAASGDLASQRVLLDGLSTMRDRSELTEDEYVERATPWARAAAASGESEDVRRAAILLNFKARMIRNRGGSVLAFIPVEAEAYRMLDELCDRGDDESFKYLAENEPTASNLALEIAQRMRKKEASAAVPRLEPEAAWLDLSHLPMPSRWERARWWVQDRRWDALDFFADLTWPLRRHWWALVDWYDRKRGRQ